MSRLEKFDATATPWPCGREAADPHRIRILHEDRRLTALYGELARACDAVAPSRWSRITSGASAEHARLTLRFVTAQFSRTALTGHLAWTDDAGRSGRGAEIDLTLLHGAIDDGVLRGYARQLLAFTPLPL